VVQQGESTPVNPFQGRPLPTWWSDAGLGILVHWGPYSVPAWAPVGPDASTVAETEGWEEALRRAPYAEWYWNGLGLEGSAVADYHAAVHGATTYEDFADDFGRASANLDPDSWAELFARAGAGYVVLTAKHHDGYLLWDSATENPRHGSAWHSDVDLVGEVAAATRRHGMRFGAYYSGGLDWTFGGLGIDSVEALSAAVPTGPAYAAYARAHWLELIDRYRPDVLWNDVRHAAGTGDAHDLFDHYYEAVPAGVVNDRFDIVGAAAGTTHADIVTPEHHALSGLPLRPFEVCRPLGTSFAWNRAEEDADLLTTEELVAVLVDVRSRGGNLLLAIGPTAHGSIPRRQRERLEGLGAWMAVNREAVVGVQPWDLPALPTSDGRIATATTASGSLYLTVCGDGGGSTVSVTGLPLTDDHDVHLLGHPGSLRCHLREDTVLVELPPGGPHPPVLRISPAPNLRRTASG